MEHLPTAILEILREDWGNRDDEFEAYWFGYKALKNELHDRGVSAELKEIKAAMKELEKENKVELAHTYNEDWKIAGRGWFVCR